MPVALLNYHIANNPSPHRSCILQECFSFPTSDLFTANSSNAVRIYNTAQLSLRIFFYSSFLPLVWPKVLWLFTEPGYCRVLFIYQLN